MYNGHHLTPSRIWNDGQLGERSWKITDPQIKAYILPTNIFRMAILAMKSDTKALRAENGDEHTEMGF